MKIWGFHVIRLRCVARRLFFFYFAINGNAAFVAQIQIGSKAKDNLVEGLRGANDL
jgi:hypothetical protein